jgi:hypothetical protein
MAVTVTIKNQNSGVTVGTINLGTGYTTGGVAVSGGQLGCPNSLVHLDCSPAGGHVFEWDQTNGKIKAYRQKDPAAAGGADIALPEVGNGTDLSAITARFEAVGV